MFCISEQWQTSEWSTFLLFFVRSISLSLSLSLSLSPFEKKTTSLSFHCNVHYCFGLDFVRLSVALFLSFSHHQSFYICVERQLHKQYRKSDTLHNPFTIIA